MFTKLFTINYHNKEFLLLVNDKNVYGFLEVKDNKYYYPDFEDFKELFTMYNLFRDVKFEGAPKYDFFQYATKTMDEIIKKIIIPVYVGIIAGLVVDVVINPETNVIKYGERVVVSSATEFNNYIGYKKIDVYDVFKAIDNNKYLTSKNKKIAKNLVVEKVRNNSDIDLRIVYENFNKLKVYYKTQRQLKFKYQRNIAGCFVSKYGIIYLTNDNPKLVSHELSHIFHNIDHCVDGKIVSFYDGDNCFSEWLTTKEGDMATGLEGWGYKELEIFYDFLLKHTDKFGWKVYDEYGINPFKDELKEKYPDINIDYIFKFFNGKIETELIDNKKMFLLMKMKSY